MPIHICICIEREHAAAELYVGHVVAPADVSQLQVHIFHKSVYEL